MRFHIHLNLINVSHEAHEEIVDLGLLSKPFEAETAFSSQFTPIFHLSTQMEHGEKFRRTFANVRECLSQHKGILGYMEGEYVLRQKKFGNSCGGPNDPNAAHGLKLMLMPARSWRRSEIHITIVDSPESKKIISQLMDSGFYYTSMRKGKALNWIFTAQGNKPVIDEIYTQFLSRISSWNGSIEGKIKEERSLGYWVSPGYTWIMPQVKKLVWE